MKEILKEYSNGEITVIWQPHLCTHCGICANELPEVFQPSERPWVKINSASTDQIREQVKKCPSLALSYRMNNDDQKNEIMADTTIEIIPKGPLVVKGTVCITHPDGTEEVKENRCSLCRCGASANKPYCDGTHRNIDFE